ncbi:hypothetical protein [Embleya sp. NPDC020630]|uniref:hypothetical protein n=1 Tax=Embleya sp. NPDC020630 TaxID=3363979 RepID=UPI0037A12F9F
MTDPVVMFPDGEALAVAFLTPRLPGVTVVSEWPEDLAEHLPVVAVSRVGGSTELRFVFEDVVLDFDVLAATKASAQDLAQSVRALLMTAPSHPPPGARIYSVTDDALVWGPDPVTELPRYVLTMTLRVRPA